jgi:urease beta subunit
MISLRQVSASVQTVDLAVGGTIEVPSGTTVLCLRAHNTPDVLQCSFEGGADGQVVVVEVEGAIPIYGVRIVSGGQTEVAGLVEWRAGTRGKLIWRRDGIWRVA